MHLQLTKKHKIKADAVLTKEFFEEHYIQRKLSFPKIKNLVVAKHGMTLDSRSIRDRAIKHGIQTRSRSDANRLRSVCDYSKTFMTEELIEAVDGFLLGDGGIRATNTCAAFACCVKHEEFCNYLMLFFNNYYPTVKRYTAKDKRIKGGMTIGYRGRSKYHPDIRKQYERWYKNGVKIVPEDVRITPLSVMLWFLGDGSFYTKKGKGVGKLTLCTNGFSDKDRNHLIGQLKKIHIFSYSEAQGATLLNTASISVFFNFIGWSSPVQCYDYKFSCDPQLTNMISLRHPDVITSSELFHKYCQGWIKQGSQK